VPLQGLGKISLLLVKGNRELEGGKNRGKASLYPTEPRGTRNLGLNVQNMKRTQNIFLEIRAGVDILLSLSPTITSSRKHYDY